MKKIISFIILLFSIFVSFYFYLENKKLKAINNENFKIISNLKEKNKLENNLWLNYFCKQEFEFDFNKDKFLLYKKYYDLLNNWELKNFYNKYKIINSSFMFSLNEWNLELTKKILNDNKIGKLFVETKKIKLLIELLKSINFSDLDILSFWIEKLENNNDLDILFDLINTKINNSKNSINILKSLNLDLPYNFKISNNNLSKLEKLKVNEIILNKILSNTKEFLKNSIYIEKIIYPDWINYNWKKAFYFIKRNWKIYIYDNLWKRIN